MLQQKIVNYSICILVIYFKRGVASFRNFYVTKIYFRVYIFVFQFTIKNFKLKYIIHSVEVTFATVFWCYSPVIDWYTDTFMSRKNYLNDKVMTKSWYLKTIIFTTIKTYTLQLSVLETSILYNYWIQRNFKVVII